MAGAEKKGAREEGWEWGRPVEGGKMDPMIEELCRRFARIEAWFDAPRVRCRFCHREYDLVLEGVGKLEGGYILGRVAFVRVVPSKEVDKLVLMVERCYGCAEKAEKEVDE